MEADTPEGLSTPAPSGEGTAATDLPPVGSDTDEVKQPATFEEAFDIALGGEAPDADDATGKEPVVDPDAPVEDEPEKKKPDAEPSEEQTQDPELSNEELIELGKKAHARTLSFKDHPNWRKMVADRNTAKAEVEKLTPVAQRMGQIDDFLNTHRVSADEAAEALQIMAAVKTGDAQEAYRRLEPIMRDLQTRAGVALDPKLQEEVQRGYIPPEAAKRISQLNAQNRQLQETRQRELQQAEQARRQQDAEQAQARQVHMAREANALALQWSTQKKTSDPDYARKEPFLESALARWQQQNGLPQTVADVERALEESYAAISTNIAQLVPKKPPVQHNPKRPSGGSKEKPGSFEEAFEQGYAS